MKHKPDHGILFEANQTLTGEHRGRVHSTVKKVDKRKKKQPDERAACGPAKPNQFLRRRVEAATPTRPRPSSARVPGSGTPLKSTVPLALLIDTRLPLMITPWRVLLKASKASAKNGFGSAKKAEPMALSQSPARAARSPVAAAPPRVAVPAPEHRAKFWVALKVAPPSSLKPDTPSIRLPTASRMSSPWTPVTLALVLVLALAFWNVVLRPGSA